MTPPAPRALFRPGPEGLEIVIPAVRNVVLLLFLAVWLVGWLVGEVTALAAFAGLLAIQPSPDQAFLGFWLIFWTLGGGCAALAWLWTLGGAERLLMGSSVLTLQWRVFGVGPAWEYELHRMHSLRVMPGQSAPPKRSRAILSGLRSGRIGFDYDGRTIRFGAGLPEPEARSMVDRMKARYAFGETAITPEGGHAI